MREFTRGLLKFVGVVALLAAIAGGVLYAFFVKVVDIGHNGMAPTMILGDRVLVWRTQEFELGEPVLCRHPEQPGRYVIGRVVGRPGNVVAFERGSLTINGRSPDLDVRGLVIFQDAERGRQERMQYAIEDILDHDHPIFMRERSQPRMSRPHRVTGGLFLMSDNRTYVGEDSRAFGEVDSSTCVGRVFMRLTAAPSPSEVGNGVLDIID